MQKHRHIITLTLATAALSAVVGSCRKQDAAVPGFPLTASASVNPYAGVKAAEGLSVRQLGEDSSLGLKWTVSDLRDPETKGGTVHDTFSSLHCWGYYTKGPWTKAATVNYCSDDFIQDGALFVSDGRYPEVPSTMTTTFFAVAPADESLLSYGDKAGNEYKAGFTGYPTVRVTIPASVSDQKDILATVAPYTQAGSPVGSFPLIFRHILSGVCFRLGSVSAPTRIEAVELRNVRASRTYSLDGTWMEGYSSNSTISTRIEVGRDFAATANSGEHLGGDDDIIFIVPQEFLRGCKIRVYHSADRYDYTETSDDLLSSSGGSFEEGKLNTFIINL